MSLKLVQKFTEERPVIDARCGVQVTPEVHEAIQDISFKTGFRIKEVVDMLMRYAIENIEWDKE